MFILYRLVLPILLLVYLSESCQDDWTEYNSHCYRLFTDMWSDAQNECLNHGSTLVKIETAAENSWLKINHSLLGGPWIGAYTKTRSVWFWVSDNSIVTYTDWIPGQPSDSGGNQDCVHIHDSGWNDLSCTTFLPYLCEKEG